MVTVRSYASNPIRLHAAVRSGKGAPKTDTPVYTFVCTYSHPLLYVPLPSVQRKIWTVLLSVQYIDTVGLCLKFTVPRHIQ